MTCRPLFWITAAAVSLGAVLPAPSIAAGLDEGWAITVDGPASEVVESKHLTIEGSASHGSEVVEGVTVTATPIGLPSQCGPEAGDASVVEDRYVIEFDVDCNGPYEVEVEAHSSSGSGFAEPRTIGVEELPLTPEQPTLLVTTEGGLKATWVPGNDPDSEGSILVVNFRQDRFDAGVAEAILPPADRGAAVAVQALRWGAEGPGTTVSSPESAWSFIGESNPDEPNNTDPPPGNPNSDPPADPGPEPPPAPLPPGSNGPPSTPRHQTPADPAAPSPVSASTTAPVLPTGAPTTAVSETARDRRAARNTDERALLTASPAGGMVRTADDRPTSLAVPIGLALLLSAVVALIWHRHRPLARDPGAGGSDHGSGTTNL